MRLAAAARFLAQLESVVAKPGTEKDGDGHGGRFMWPRPLRVWKDLRPQSAFGEHSAMPEDPLDKKGLLQATKERSSPDLLQNEKSSWEGVLRNSGKQKREYKDEEQRNTVQLCDPQVDEADVGLLSCGFNYYCAESHDSYLGGVCVEAWNGSDQQGRRLEDGTDGAFDVVGGCDPSSPDFGKCDCTMFDSVSGNGYIKCLKDLKSCCPTLCLETHAGGEVRIRSSILPTMVVPNDKLFFMTSLYLVCDRYHLT